MPIETIGRYEVESVIGRGAMAVVYKAVDPTIGRTVALKAMRFDVHGIEKGEVLSRFRNEARAAGKLMHPNLVTIYDAGEQEGTFYIAMECVDGRTLQALLAEERFLSLDRTVDVLAQICAGLDYAHANGVIHRDIKPANIMVTRNGVLKIMDFGIAKAGAQLTTGGGDILGTPNYISPEMVKGERIDGRSDLFSVAVILHEMLLGERPFSAPNIGTIIYKIVNEPLSPDLETKVHPALAAILRKSLAKHPSDRYQSGADLVGALKSYQALLNEPPPRVVFPGTPISQNWAQSTGRKPSPPGGAKVPASTTYSGPEVFGSDVPDHFRAPAPSGPSQVSRASQIPLLDKRPQAPALRVANGASAAIRTARLTEEPAGTASATSALEDARKKTFSKLFAAVAIILVVLALAALYRFVEASGGPKKAAYTPSSDPYPVTQGETPKAIESASSHARSVDATATDETDSAETVIVTKKKVIKTASLGAPDTSAPASTAPLTALLEISTTPDGAAVQVDGQNRPEKTPFSVSGLSAGLHTLILTKPGYLPISRTVELMGGTNANLAVELEIAPTAIAFTSNPSGATVFVDDDPTGQTTPATLRLAPGSHSISLVKQGFEEGTGNVQLEQGETQHFSVTLQPADRDARIRSVFGGAKDKAMLVVRSRPRGAHIRVDDSNVEATTPTRLVVKNGKTRVTVEKEGYKPYRRELKLEKGDIVVVEAFLEPKN